MSGSEAAQALLNDIAADGETTSDLALAAAERAIQHAGIDVSEIDLVICATTTPDNTFPSTVAKVHRLGMTNGAAFDVQAVCSGFVYGLAVADNFIRAGQAKTVVLIGAETFSRILDWNDRGTCVLFGTGQGPSSCGPWIKMNLVLRVATARAITQVVGSYRLTYILMALITTSYMWMADLRRRKPWVTFA